VWSSVLPTHRDQEQKMTIQGVPEDLFDINSQEEPCRIEILFGVDSDQMWISMNGKTIMRLYGVGRVDIVNARNGDERVELGWDVKYGPG
jgi:hypothetical protein